MRSLALALSLGTVMMGCSNASPPPAKTTPVGVSTVAPVAPTAPPSGSSPSAAQRSIGTATMQADGTIVLQLRAEDGAPAGTVGDAQLLYPPSHPKYQETLKHLNGLKPGESKPVPPWP